MIKVLIVAGARPLRPAVLNQALVDMHAEGAQTSIVCQFPTTLVSDSDITTEVYDLRDAEFHPPGAVRAAIHRAGPGMRMWLRMKHNPWVAQHLADVDVIIAVDRPALYAVWQLAQRYPKARAIFGLNPGIEAVRAVHAGTPMPTHPRRPGDMQRAALREGAATAIGGGIAAVHMVSGHNAMRLGLTRRAWRGIVSLPGLPAGKRDKIAKRIYKTMSGAGFPADAEAVVVAASKKLPSADARRDLLAGTTLTALGHGRVPTSLAPTVAEQLAAAERARAAGKFSDAAVLVDSASRMLFHRNLHFDAPRSPLADDPAGFLAPWHESKIGQRLAAPRGRERTGRTRAPGKHRLLMITGVNDNFLAEIRDRYADHPEVELRTLDLMRDKAHSGLVLNTRGLIADVLAGGTAYGEQARQWLTNQIAWADTVFVDWCVMTAALMTIVDPGDTRMVLRLHSFEAFTAWPHLVDFSRIDDMIFVSDHVRDLGVAAIPRLAGPNAPALHVISNAMDLHRYVGPKPAEARFTLGVVSYAKVVKDPRWAIEVLRELRRKDERYRLILVGPDFGAEAGALVEAYQEQLEQDLAELEPIGAITRTGATADVPAALTGIGVIISSSTRESFHCALVEGAASGAVPVVRDWPFFAAQSTGARTLFPSDWVVADPQEAASRILALTQDEQTWREAGAAAADHALSTWDWSVTSQHFDRLLAEPQ